MKLLDFLLLLLLSSVSYVAASPFQSENPFRNEWLLFVDWSATNNDLESLQLSVGSRNYKRGLEGYKEFLKDLESCSEGALLIYKSNNEDNFPKTGDELTVAYMQIQKKKDFVEVFLRSDGFSFNKDQINILRWKTAVDRHDYKDAKYFFNNEACGIGSNGFNICIEKIRSTDRPALFIVGSYFIGDISNWTPFRSRRKELDNLIDKKKLWHLYKTHSFGKVKFIPLTPPLMVQPHSDADKSGSSGQK